MFSAITPMPPARTPFLYNGSPEEPGEKPSGDRCGPGLVAPGTVGAVGLKSEHDSWLNWVPNKGPPGVLRTPGLKCSCRIWLAVRVVKAFPFDDRYAPVIARAIAPIVVGITLGGTTVRFSRPAPILRPVSMVSAVGAPGIWATVRTLPTRLTTAIVDGLPRALASLIACRTMALTSPTVRFGAAPVEVGAAGLVAMGGGKSPPAPPPPPPQPEGAAHHTASMATAARNAGCANRPGCRRAVIVRAPWSLPLPPDGVSAASNSYRYTRFRGGPEQPPKPLCFFISPVTRKPYRRPN